MILDPATTQVLQNTALFHGIKQEAYASVLQCLGAQRHQYERGEQIHHVGNKMSTAGLVLSGLVDVALYNESGNQLSINRFDSGEIFGESFACLQSEKCPVSVHAVSDCEVIFIRLALLFTPQKMNCTQAAKVTENLVQLLAKKNVFLNQKVQILAQKKIRDKIKVSLQTEMANTPPGQDEKHYVIRFNRDEMARYLGVDRSALSRELCNMRDEGILSFQRNHIKMLDPSFLFD